MAQMFGSKNPQWKGDKVKYGSLHDYIKVYLKRDKRCNSCGLKKKLDLSNKSGKYKRELLDWEWLCRKCHMELDGRNGKLRLFGRSRRIPDRICKFCRKKFHRKSGMLTAKFCSRKCFTKAGGSWWKKGDR
jgi:hypothetical protein